MVCVQKCSFSTLARQHLPCAPYRCTTLTCATARCEWGNAPLSVRASSQVELPILKTTLASSEEMEPYLEGEGGLSSRSRFKYPETFWHSSGSLPFTLGSQFVWIFEGSAQCAHSGIYHYRRCLCSTSVLRHLVSCIFIDSEREFQILRIVTMLRTVSWKAVCPSSMLNNDLIPVEEIDSECNHSFWKFETCVVRAFSTIGWDLPLMPSIKATIQILQTLSTLFKRTVVSEVIVMETDADQMNI